VELFSTIIASIRDRAGNVRAQGARLPAALGTARTRRWSGWCRLRHWLGGGLCLIAVAQFCPLRTGIVQGHSMAPTLAPGSLFVYDHTYYRHHPLRSGDVVLVRQGKTVWVKRVYAVEGESFWTYRERQPDGQFRRDPIAPGQVRRFSQVAAHDRNLYGRDVEVVRLRRPQGLVFLVGDGYWSLDSRTFGPLAQADVIGRVVELPGQHFGSAPDHIVLSFPSASPDARGRTQPNG
jgi:signal peptidase I